MMMTTYWSFFVLVLVVTARCWAAPQNATSDTIEWPSFSNSSSSGSSGRNNLTGDAEKTNTSSAFQEDLMKSVICQSCLCQDEGSTSLVIDCNGKSLTDAFLFPDWPSDILISSIEARFDDNQFTEIAQYPKLPLLRLSYRHNSIQAIQKAAFKFLASLEYLDLTGNNLTHESLSRDVFEGPFNEVDDEPIPLKTLRLGYNQIHSLDNDVFKHIALHLETLELNNNPLNIIDRPTAMAISSLKKLKILNLAETNLVSNGVPDDLFHPLRNLKILLLNGNDFSLVPLALQRAINLEYLNLNGNPIQSLNAESFQGLTALKGLNISSMPVLEKIDINTFTPLTSMVHLWCSFNPSLRKFHRGAFNNMGISDGTLKLSEFHFRGNRVPTLSSTLLPWNEIDVVDMQDNSFLCDCRIGWLVKSLIPSMEERTPEISSTLTCLGPEEYKGRALAELQQDSNIVTNCSGRPHDIYDDDFTDDHPFDRPGRRPSSAMASSFNVGLMIISLFGIALVIGGIACMGLLAIRKSHLRQVYDSASGQIVHYVRTPAGKMEDERAIVAREYTPYDEEP